MLQRKLTTEVKAKICTIVNAEMEAKNIQALSLGVVDGKDGYMRILYSELFLGVESYEKFQVGKAKSDVRYVFRVGKKLTMFLQKKLCMLKSGKSLEFTEYDHCVDVPIDVASKLEVLIFHYLLNFIPEIHAVSLQTGKKNT